MIDTDTLRQAQRAAPRACANARRHLRVATIYRHSDHLIAYLLSTIAGLALLSALRTRPDHFLVYATGGAIVIAARAALTVGKVRHTARRRRDLELNCAVAAVSAKPKTTRHEQHIHFALNHTARADPAFLRFYAIVRTSDNLSWGTGTWASYLAMRDDQQQTIAALVDAGWQGTVQDLFDTTEAVTAPATQHPAAAGDPLPP